VVSLWKSRRKRVRIRKEGEMMQRSWATQRWVGPQGQESEGAAICRSWIMEVPWAWE